MADTIASERERATLAADLRASSRFSSDLQDTKNPFGTSFDQDKEEEEAEVEEDEWWTDEKHGELLEDEDLADEEEDLAGEKEDEKLAEEEYPGNPENTPIIPTNLRATLWSNSEQKDPPAEEITAARNPTPRKTVKRYSVQKPMREKSRGRQRKQNAKAGIKVITDFSKHNNTLQVAQPTQAPVAASQTAPTGNFVNLATLQALDREVPVQPTGWNFWSKKPKDSKTEVAKSGDKAKSTGVVEAPTSILSTNRNKSSKRGLAPAPLKLDDDLSPNDRPIVIGLTVSSARLAEHASSPQTAGSDATRIVQSYQDRGIDYHSPETETPTIMVTRASDDPTWPHMEEDDRIPQRRPTSSIYSQATNISPNPNNHGSVPPVPAVPAYMMKAHKAQQNETVPSGQSAVTVYDNNSASPQRSSPRRISTFTVFEEDETPVREPVARHQVETNDPVIDRNESVSTPVNNRRSKGWWNYVMTPFMTRSNTVAARHDVMKDGQPTTPNLEAAAIKARDSNRADQVWEKDYTPTTATTISSDTWWDRNVHGNVEPRAPERQTAEPGEPERDEYVRKHRVQESSATIPFVMSGSIRRDSIQESRQPPVPSNNPFHSLNRQSSSSNATNQAERDLARQASAATAFSNNDREIPLVFDIDSPVQRRNNPFMQPRPSVLAPSSSVRMDQNNLYQNFPPPPPAPVNVTNIKYNIAPGRGERVESQDRAENASPYVSPRAPPPYSPPRHQFVRFAAREQARTSDNDVSSGHSHSPGPASPGLQQIMTSAGGIPLHDVPLGSPRRRPINLNSGYPASRPIQTGGAYITAADLVTPAELARKAEARRKRHEKEEAIAHKVGGFWKGRGCIPKRGCLGRKGDEGRKKRRRYLCLIIAFILVISLILSLALTLTRKSHSVESTQWLNLTGFPPIFLGISTVAVPVNTLVDTSCVTPATFWSCDLPKELQSTVAPNGPNQPNFRLEIQWDNSSAANATFANVTGDKNLPVKRSLQNHALSAGQFFKRLFLGARQTISFNPVPPPPSFAEEFFLGNTTDGIVSSKKAGEPTPFYMTFLSPTADVSADLNLLRKRESSASNSTSNSNSSTDGSFPDIVAGIPPPSINEDGTAAPANLLPDPLPIQQPIRLYDRGLPTEHYGFYSYFDRSIFLSSVNLTTGSGEVPIDENGGSTEDEAKFRCTWAQTRFLIQIWTNMGNSAQLLNASSSQSTASTNTQISNPHQPTRNFTANDFSQPGSFPYPVTVTLDRHGGDAQEKEIYCYQIDDRQTYVDAHPTIQLEDRESGGTLISPAPSVFNNRTVVDGGVDGGSGGCKCGWENFVAVANAGR